jgi:nucleoside-triphosphatase THEP1
MSIYIFSRPVHSGKTTELQEWCAKQNNTCGILMPDINGSRKVYDIANREIFDIECSDAATTKAPLVSIGRFHFYTKAFEKANSILLHALSQQPGWLVIDEAGKLELAEKGFYPSIKEAVAMYHDEGSIGNLLITVRESLCSEVISFFNIKNYTIITRLEDIGQKNPR